jgi:NitT/TauT family transport system substrate-binding protein
MFRIIIAGFAALSCLIASHAGAADKIIYQLGFLPQGGNANAYLALHKGLFAAENLDVTILTGRGAVDTMTKVATGAADIGEVSFDVFLASHAEQSIPVKAVMVEFSRPPDALVTTTTSGINSLKDVTGKKIATPTFTSSNLVWPVILKQHGVDPANVTLIKVDPSTLAGMLATGQADGLIMWASGASAVVPALTAVGKTMKVIPWANSGYEGYGQGLVASNRFISERPEVLRRFLKVMKQALHMVYENPDQAAQSMKALLPQADVAMFRAQIEATRPYFFNEISQRDGLGMYAPDRVKSSWEWVSKANNYPANKLDPMSVIDSRFVTR